MPKPTNLTITNPLVLYRSLISTQKIRPDPAQHRLALHLQCLYERLLDYEPTIDYATQLRKLSRALDVPSQHAQQGPLGSFDRSWIWKRIIGDAQTRADERALTAVLTDTQAAAAQTSPRGLLLHGDVGTGKSMLVDLFWGCLPSERKGRWHFDTFMLWVFARLEVGRKRRGQGNSEEHALGVVARELVEKTPVLFLDEFQFPDRVASKVLVGLLTAFFQLGGVLVATSNRMPDELAKAAGMEFARPARGFGRLGWHLGVKGVVRKMDGAGQKGEFAAFLEVLKARCEVWEMEGKRDYRKLEIEEGEVNTMVVSAKAAESAGAGPAATTPMTDTDTTKVTLPKHYLIQPTTAGDLTTFAESFNTLVEHATAHPYPIPWTPTTLTVYGRTVTIPAQHSGVAFFTFTELCSALLGPADYVSLASTYHTFIITDIPVLTFARKHEARRLITMLDACYEARCRLLITASTDPDSLFFPAAPPGADPLQHDDTQDATYPETYAEIHQDLTSPFRPNVSSYGLPSDALEDDPPNRARRAAGVEESAFDVVPAPDFANLRGLTGEDEVFAVRRAQSRVWVMCGGRWWGRGVDAWRPLGVEARHWEGVRREEEEEAVVVREVDEGCMSDVKMGEMSEAVERKRPNRPPGSDGVEDMFPHGASPFRTTADPPPKFDGSHAWGTVRWGKKAGAWGKGVEGLEERQRAKEGDGEDK